MNFLDFFVYLYKKNYMSIKWSNEKENLKRLIESNVPYEVIGRQYGVTGNAIKKAAKKQGIELKPKRTINANETFNKGLKSKWGWKYNECPICGNKKYFAAELCSDCRKKSEQIDDRTLGSFTDGHKYLTIKCASIRRDARNKLENSNKEKVCQYCKNHEFDDILEVHHLKGILEFDSSAKISEINALDNLVWLCPNHHRMIELGLITL